ncbi:septum site-determining protein MinC [Apilactobacillus micheneri]|uniref:Probable septum site-determining protein MinC n=1 Tax=Apilactobacillus micheneri TaxID=1899430 RepID=A0A2S2JJC8_9LACO|nr:septum site-determining protein MinC [Apilactobacillus micheneri]TPR39382.1 cell division inhibitor [Apilactobacillus micheneri]TPR41584.1 cell division inhibitor [Apilactobacillus micheneri]TPR43487.1 cell division inhibitor [Apilactobacillus micheneri]TPR44396.1 cell division inhibitor [Apilactobacillus micheneri]TPR44604.1 cell division inhibitor [Apilactobacillus micheneri]
MQSAVLKGTQSGYEVILDESSSLEQINIDLKNMLNRLSENNLKKSENIKLNIRIGNRLFSQEQKNIIIDNINSYHGLSVGHFISNVLTKEDAKAKFKQKYIEPMSKTIRNGQEVNVDGDVLFFGTVHEGGKLFASGNIYNMGNVKGIIQAGYPDNEDKLIIGNLHNAQQVRVGEQYDIVSDNPIDDEENTVVYVNDLHLLSYGKINDLKEINPKFFNRIGGII